MLVSMVQTMNEAKKAGYCVPAFGVGNEVNVRAVLDAAEAKRSPVILLVMAMNTPDMQYLGRICQDLGVRAGVPVSVILDHGATYEEAIRAIQAGFTDIMIDRSTLPYEENVAQVKELVKAAHAIGVGVEGELGHVGFGDNDAHNAFTVPSEAVDFVERTGIDALAVSIGTIHGAYKGEPNLQFGLLEELAAKVSVPLALHGGSGTGDDNLAQACRMGINKLNIAYDLYRGAIDAIQAVDCSGNGAYGLFAYIHDGIKKTAEHFMDVAGSTGRA